MVEAMEGDQAADPNLNDDLVIDVPGQQQVVPDSVFYSLRFLIH